MLRSWFVCLTVSTFLLTGCDDPSIEQQASKSRKHFDQKREAFQNLGDYLEKHPAIHSLADCRGCRPDEIAVPEDVYLEAQTLLSRLDLRRKVGSPPILVSNVYDQYEILNSGGKLHKTLPERLNQGASV